MLESKIEARLANKMKELGGIAIKLPANLYTGIPDRMCLLPGGALFFVELKQKGKKPTAIQLWWARWLKQMEFEHFVIDTMEGVEELAKLYAARISASSD